MKRKILNRLIKQRRKLEKSLNRYMVVNGRRTGKSNAILRYLNRGVAKLTYLDTKILKYKLVLSRKARLR